MTRMLGIHFPGAIPACDLGQTCRHPSTRMASSSRGLRLLLRWAPPLVVRMPLVVQLRALRWQRGSKVNQGYHVL
jgi:hypothetical protein